MTVIHGDVLKIYEIEKDAYTQVITGSPYIDAYSFGFILAGLSTGYFDITPSFREGSIFHSLNISSYSIIIQRVYVVKYPVGTVLFDAYFRYDSQKQFNLGDFSVFLNPGEYIRVYLENNDAAPRIITGSFWWLNPPAS